MGPGIGGKKESAEWRLSGGRPRESELVEAGRRGGASCPYLRFLLFLLPNSAQSVLVKGIQK